MRFNFCIFLISLGICLEIKSCAFAAGIKKYKSIIKKKKKKHDKTVFLGKDKLNSIEILISKALVDSYISDDEYVSKNNVLREYYKMKEKIKTPKISVKYII